MNRGISGILTVVLMAILGVVSIPVVNVLDNVEASPTPTPVVVVEPTDTPSPLPTDTPTPTPIPTIEPSITPSPEGSSVTSTSSTSYTHVRTETNGVVHDVTVPGSGSYNYDDGNTSIHINNSN